MRGLIAALITVVIALASLVPTVIAPSSNITASVNVPVSCGIKLTPNTINFGDVPTGSTSSIKTVDIKNTGSGSMEYCKYEISGTDWTKTGDSFAVENTDYKCSNSTGVNCLVVSFADLTATTTHFANIEHGKTVSVDFQMSVPEGQAAGAYQQTITITVSS
ncbi:MAG: hypothetical protein QXO27_04280 [Candidatus Aenigmatarchaeota archaeon]